MKKFIIPLILVLLLIFTLTSYCWVEGYDQRIKLTTDHTKIDSTLSNFPVTAFFTAAQAEEIFAEFDADEDFDRGQFALENDTLLYAEKELFDDSASLAIYHFKVISISSSAGTDIYFYYDNDAGHNTTYIGGIDTTAGHNVWDSNFKAVYHMVDATTSTIKDSTSNNNDGTKIGANEPIEATGKVGQAQDFDTINDYINCGAGASLNITGDLTIETIIETDNDDDACVIVGKEDSSTDRQYYLRTAGGVTYSKIDFVLSDDGSAWGKQGSNNEVIQKDTFYHIASVYTAGGSPNVDLYLDGTEIASTAISMKQSIVSNADTELELGSRRNGTSDRMDGIIDEVRISASVRNATWIKATYNSLWDSLLTYGSEEKVVAVNALFFGTNL